MRGIWLVAVLAAAGCATVPPVPPGQTADSFARYACTDGARFTARFDRWGEQAVLTFERHDPEDLQAKEQDGDFRVVLAGQPVGSGIWYAGGGWSLRGKGDAATLVRPDGRTADCRAGGGASGPVASGPNAV